MLSQDAHSFPSPSEIKIPHMSLLGRSSPCQGRNTAATAWTFLLIFSSLVSYVELRDEDDMSESISDSGNSTN
ncbi:unnamed protein product, partial [Allacma fusca]